MKVTVLGFTGSINTGNYGYYVHFNDRHYSIVETILNRFNLDLSESSWLKILSHFSRKGNVITRSVIFPEFQFLSDLRRFVSFLNNGCKVNSNFIDLAIIL